MGEDNRMRLLEMVNDLDCIADEKSTQSFTEGFCLATKLMIDVLF